MYGWIDGWMDAWMHGCMDAWMHGCMDVWMHGCMDGWIDRYLCIYLQEVADSRDERRDLDESGSEL